MKRFYFAAALAVLAVGCGDGDGLAYEPVTGTERPRRFTASDADGDAVGFHPEGNPIRTPENFHPVDEVTDSDGQQGGDGDGDGPGPGDGPGGGDSGCHQSCAGNADCLAACDELCAQSDACSQCLCDNGPDFDVCATDCGL